MIFTAQTESGKIVKLNSAFKITLNKDEKTPANALHAVFSYAKFPENLVRIKMEQVDEEIFDGIIDEVIFQSGENGKVLEIFARSNEAVLLDNEAMPQTVFLPSTRILYKRFLYDLGYLEIICDDNEAKSAPFVVYKGSSVYEVLNKFATDYLGKEMHVLSKDTVLFGKKENKNVTEKTPPDSFEMERNNYDVCSHMYYKDTNTGVYSTCFKNEKAKGVLRIRYAQNNIPPNERFKVYETYNLVFSKLIVLEIDDEFEFCHEGEKIKIVVKSLQYTLLNGKEETEIRGVREV